VLRLTQERKRRNLTQFELAILTGIDVTTLSALENGRMKPYPTYVERLQNVLNVPGALLFEPAQTEAISRGEQR
jgi:transcriptional regulator with XRE-family HTH domain